MKYNEPRDWLQPTRHFLGGLLLKTKQFAKAEKLYREDLFTNPNNGWSLTGLSLALAGQHKMKDAAHFTMAAKKAFGKSDMIIKTSVL